MNRIVLWFSKIIDLGVGAGSGANLMAATPSDAQRKGCRRTEPAALKDTFTRGLYQNARKTPSLQGGNE